MSDIFWVGSRVGPLQFACRGRGSSCTDNPVAVRRGFCCGQRVPQLLFESVAMRRVEDVRRAARYGLQLRPMSSTRV